MRKILSFCILAAGAAALAGCSWSWDYTRDLFSIHRIDVQQGNALDQEDVALLREGMTPEQVHFLLGTPMVVDPFRPHRWDYVYYFRPGSRTPVLRRVTVFFENGAVARIEKVGLDEAAPRQPRGETLRETPQPPPPGPHPPEPADLG